METKKTCPVCKIIFDKPYGTSSKQWAVRFCCSVSCAAKHRGSPWLEKHKMKKGSTLGLKTRFKKGQLSGKNNPNWKDNEVGYGALHTWIQRQHGKPSFCEHCKCSNRQMYHWSNISGEYKRDRNDWQRLCVPCHKKFDIAKLK